jgi:hypothetical protein
MEYQIIWLPRAEERYQQVIDYLQQHWNDTVIKKFIAQTEKVLAGGSSGGGCVSMWPAAGLVHQTQVWEKALCLPLRSDYRPGSTLRPQGWPLFSNLAFLHKN